MAHAGSHMLFPRYYGKRREIVLHHDVGNPTLPVTHFEVGQYHLGNIPAKEHVTLPKPLLQRVQEVFRCYALATVDPLDIGCANLDILDLSLINTLFDFSDVHVSCSSFPFAGDP